MDGYILLSYNSKSFAVRMSFYMFRSASANTVKVLGLECSVVY